VFFYILFNHFGVFSADLIRQPDIDKDPNNSDDEGKKYYNEQSHSHSVPINCGIDHCSNYTPNQRKKMRQLVAFYKPKDMSSFQLVSRVRRLIGEKKVGHGGALDPLAEGLLVLGIGREGTKALASFLNKENKEYEAIFRLGEVSETYDGEGPITKISDDEFLISKQEIEDILKRFVGEISQTPPKYSAIKIGGKRAYDLARQGKEVFLKPRPVVIEKIEILDYSPPDLSLRINCGAGVYIRSLANDFGQAVGCGAYLKDLKRTRVGNFSLAEAINLDDLARNPDLIMGV